MDLLWSPWRYDYITGSGAAEKAAGADCVFCELLNSPETDERKFILHRSGHCFVILNIYPYTSGHLMIIPFEHVALLEDLPTEVSSDLMELTKKCQAAIRKVYNPDGFNIGINLGKAAGAGVAGHIHQHVLPRWIGDANFMTAIGQTRTIPEELRDTYRRLVSSF